MPRFKHDPWHDRASPLPLGPTPLPGFQLSASAQASLNSSNPRIINLNFASQPGFSIEWLDMEAIPLARDAFEAELAQLITEWTDSRHQTVPELSEAIYKELRKIARAYMRKERPDHTLQATALINEAYLRVFEGGTFQWKNRKHLFVVMAQAMRRVLIDHARRHKARKHAGGHGKMSLDEAFVVSEEKSPELSALSEAVERLSQLDARQGHVVDLRFFVGLTVEETAAVLGVSPETVKLDWRSAKAWLQREVGRAI